MRLDRTLLALALPLLMALPAVAGPAQPDILGVRLGMTPQQVKAVLAGQFPKPHEFGRHAKHVRALEFDSSNHDDRVRIVFLASPTTPPSVVLVGRRLSYSQGGPTVTATRAALVKKYGEPSSENSLRGLYWLLARTGSRAAAKRTRMICMEREAPQLLNGNGPSDLGRCNARMVSAGWFTGSDNKEIIQGLHVWLYDGVTVKKDVQAWAQKAQQEEKAKKAHQIESAAPPPKL